MMTTDAIAKDEKLVTKSALRKAWFIWETFPQTCYNYERMMGQVVAHVFVPIVKCLYKHNPEAAKALMKREIEFFNVHIEFGACIIGMIIAMEEEKAKGEDIPDSFITNIKTSLMGPLAGLGDTIWQGVVIPILLAICIDISTAGSGNIWGAVIYFVTIVTAAYSLSYANFMFGYRAGANAIMDFIEKGTLKKVLKGASVMGCMVMGGLIVNYVKVSCGIEIVNETQVFSIQKDFLDHVMPNILPLGVTMGIFWLLKNRWTSIRIIGLIIALSIVCGFLGILTY
ncbi:PTS system mannose/fructose/sorbose family transporter subunit IID [Selenomonas sp. TAMA-11512]|uniref:PTS system mannose/fructose/sorbose family transporter subunit IID n=1 Tax=Selenomonas sp. TAMA-11512 TaxID=3095337 RepID=UPI0030CFE841